MHKVHKVETHFRFMSFLWDSMNTFWLVFLKRKLLVWAFKIYIFKIYILCKNFFMWHALGISLPRGSFWVGIYFISDRVWRFKQENALRFLMKALTLSLRLSPRSFPVENWGRFFLQCIQHLRISRNSLLAELPNFQFVTNMEVERLDEYL